MIQDDIDLPGPGAFPTLEQNRAMTRRTTTPPAYDELFDLMVTEAAVVLFEEYPGSSIPAVG